ncbi:MAG: adenylosuccinate lyase [Anaerolineales bacterium]|nr:adenylosuccinate lyase [Anaerolineales bacterium]MCX7609010.1 adenylosuccinate lyase [Anaerolineales bacterium]MDW8227280.1 adenylosuccinate lyase [Anaerolineales bacterium]
MPDFETYLSPFTWRYGSPAMRRLWSEAHKRLLWRQIWVALAEVQAEYGLVTSEQVADLRAHLTDLDLPRALELEAEIQHDLMAELRLFAGQCPLGGKILHLGATSMDIEDNADALRLRAALDLLLESLASLLQTLSLLIEKWADTPLIAFTHLQPAEPSTLGYRLALYGQDLLQDYEALRHQRARVRGKGFKGAVGTGAAYADLIGADKLDEFEKKLSQKLGLSFFPVTAQVYPRRQDYEILSTLAGLGASLYKFAFDLRLLQSPPIGEMSEPFGERQVGSSAMPFKRNPIRAEKMNSLARYLASLPRLAWDNAAHSLLERTLDDSANRRILLPEAFLAADELLRTASNIVSRLQVNESAIQHNLSVYAPFAATEAVLMALTRRGADRQEMHERLRRLSMQAWETVRRGEANPLTELICQEVEITEYLSEEELRALMATCSRVGNAPQRAREMAQRIRETLA